MNEIWVPTIRNPKYQVSNLGRVRVIKPGNRIKILKPRLKFGRNDSPRLTVAIYIKSKRHEIKISILVLETFIGPRPPRFCASHLNDDHANNRLTNLAWETNDQNQRRKGWNKQSGMDESCVPF
jgi:hypothetical protein